MLGYFLLFVHLIGRKQNDSYVLHGGLYQYLQGVCPSVENKKRIHPPALQTR
jgi:hypothetical protein